MRDPRAKLLRNGSARRQSVSIFALVPHSSTKSPSLAFEATGCSIFGIGSAGAIPSGHQSDSCSQSELARKNSRSFWPAGKTVTSIFTEAPLARNIPVLMALLGIWYRNIWGYSTHAVIPYDERLARFPVYLQQLEMESNGKSVDLSGSRVDFETAPIIFGENGQHAFFQLLHQGTSVVPIDFLVAENPLDADVEHHNLLLANAWRRAKLS